MRLSARPTASPPGTLVPGTTALELTNGRPGLLHVPDAVVTGLVVALHGAGGQARAALDLLRSEADHHGLVVLAPASGGSSWAGLFGRPDPDTAALDAALQAVLDRHPFDPASVSVAGFSDGASYALSLGLANGDLFGRVVAFSPGFENAGTRRGRPRFLITHGVRDTVLPIDRTSRRLVPALRRKGYDVSYHEFDAGHLVPPHHVAEAARWLTTQD